MEFIQNFYDYVQYFRELAASTTYFKFFQAGGAERIVSERLLSDSRGRIEGPLLFVEWPFLKLSDYGSSNTLIRYTGAFVVLENPAKDDWVKQDEAMNNTFLATQQVLGRVKIDTTGLDKRFLYFDLNLVALDPIENLMIDQWYGWRCEFGIICPLDIAMDLDCLDPGFWKEGEKV